MWLDCGEQRERNHTKRLLAESLSRNPLPADFRALCYSAWYCTGDGSYKIYHLKQYLFWDLDLNILLLRTASGLSPPADTILCITKFKLLICRRMLWCRSPAWDLDDVLSPLCGDCLLPGPCFHSASHGCALGPSSSKETTNHEAAHPLWQSC